MVFAHANGFSWDEALMVLAPIAVLAAILLYANNKLRRGLGDQLLDDASADDPSDAGRDVTEPTADPTASS